MATVKQAVIEATSPKGVVVTGTYNESGFTVMVVWPGGQPVSPVELERVIDSVLIILDDSYRIPSDNPEQRELWEKLDTSTLSLEFSTPALKTLAKNHIFDSWEDPVRFIGQLVTRSREELLKRNRVGKKIIHEVEDNLARMGIRLKMKPEQLRGWKPPQD